MNPKINIDNLVRQTLPPHKRQPVRLVILRAMLSRIKELFAGFDPWRSDVRMMLNVNSQVIILEGYLRKKFGQPVSIKIVTFDDGLLSVGYELEGLTMMRPVGDTPENIPAVPFAGEIRERFGDADFIVYIPAGVDIDLIRAEIERYKRATAEYKIIQN